TEEPRKEDGDSNNDQEKEDDNVNSTNNVNTASDGNNTNNVNVVSSTVNAAMHKLTTAKEINAARPKENDTQVPQSSVPSDPTNIVDKAVHEEPKANLGDQEDTFKQGRKIDDIDKDAEITLVNET
ncbi:hypothetical protein Tco_1287002, partial [Tanacetum coccineum]